MKKELRGLLSMESGYLKLSKIAHLHRWQTDALGNPVDRLEICFNSPTGRTLFYEAEILSRDTEGIMGEIAHHTKAFADKWAHEEAKKMLAGRIDGRLW